MDYLFFLDSTLSSLPEGCSEAGLATILSVVKWVVKWICIAIPIILIVLVILDLAKVVTAGNIDDKMKKEVSQKVVTRVIYSIIIFLVPTLVNLFFSILPEGVKTTSDGRTYDGNWWTCYRNVKA